MNKPKIVKYFHAKQELRVIVCEVKFVIFIIKNEIHV